MLLLLLVSGGGDDPRSTGEMKGVEVWDEDDVVLLVAREEAANSGIEGYEGSRRTVGALPGIGWPVGVPSTYPSGLKPRAMARTELGEGTAVWPW